MLFALLEERIDRPVLELIELLATTPAEDDMAPEANRMILELLDREHEAALLEHEYRSLAIRDPSYAPATSRGRPRCAEPSPPASMPAPNSSARRPSRRRLQISQLPT